MSNDVFPALPGLKWGVTRTPVWSTKVQTSASGRELRANYWSYPVWRYSLSYEVLRAHAAYQELQRLVGFFNARRGQFDTFLYDDPTDNAATDQPLGVVRAGVNQYKLVRTYGGWVEPVHAPKPGIVLKANGAVLTPGTQYTMGDNGVITLSGGASIGQALTWTGGFYWRCRFIQDQTDFEHFLQRLWSARRVEFQTVKV